MKKLLFIFLLLLISCKNEKKIQEIPKEKIPVSQNINTDDWQEGFGITHNPETDSIWGKPVKFYLDNENCDLKAKDFYFGKYRPTDEPETARLLMLLMTDDDNLRPFYRWILNKTILIQDGALGEYTGVPARNYAEKFPKEFFEYMDYDKSGEKYSDWVNAILYSGFYDNEDYFQPPKKSENMRVRMFENCKDCSKSLKRKIEKFSEDCFSDH